MKITDKRPIRDEKGQALVLTLIFLLVGMIILTPLLNFMGTGITGGRVYEQKVDEIYAADAGVEDALWHIRYDQIEDLLVDEGYDEYDYSIPCSYPDDYDMVVNDNDVGVTIQNIWIPKDIPDPSPPTPSEARQIIEDENLIIIGYPSSTESTYEIKVVYDWDTTQERDALKAETIGIWLSPGFEYDGDCSLVGYYYDENVSLYKGGYAVVWDFASVPLKELGTTDDPMVITFTFKYTGPEGQLPELVSSWIDTSGVTGITYAWDDSIRLYKIVSEAGGVEIEAYGAKTKFRKLKSTISSDYTVAGNNLMEATGSGSDSYYRNRLYAEMDSTTQLIGLESIPESSIVPAGCIPEEAIIEDVYLYWTGWIDYHYCTEEWVCRWVFRWPGGWQEECGWEGSWDTIPDLRYPSSPTEENLTTLVEESAKVNIVKFDVDNYAQTITADKWQTANTDDCSGAADSWAYSCFADVTDLLVSGNLTVQEYIEEAMKSDGAGDVTFTVGHADEVRGVQRPDPGSDTYYFELYGDGQSTGYPLATPAHKYPGEHNYQNRYQWTHSSWSLIIFYRSPALKQRQLYLFDDLRYISHSGGGDNPEFSISGFLAPPVLSEEDKSHLTYLVGEGDAHYWDSSIEVNEMYLSDPPDNPWNNVFNSYSNALPELDRDTDGVDIDTFELPDGCIMPYDTQAKVTLITEQEIYVLVYIVLSFRSDLTTGGIITNYSVKVT